MAKKKADKTSPEIEAAAEYTVVARRYRPRQFNDLVGQDAVSQALANAIKTNRVAHAYLFTGARGVGKTSTARILAKCLNCVNGPTITPCDQCELCKAIATGDDVDVLEIDGASNGGIDEVREIRNNVQYRPQRSRYKIYIIDEVHMLSTPAFNALLKTLEEPPPHVKFIFATTEANEIPITILSRCQRFDFSGIGMSQLRQRLKAIVEEEGMKADDDAIELIARRAAGSMRDGQSLLDQLLSFGGDTLTVEQVHGLLGTANEERITALATAVFAHEPRKALDVVAEAADRGLQVGELLDQLVDYWRDLMVVQAAGIEGQSLSVTGANRAALESQAKATTPETILAGLDVLVTAKNRLRGTSQARVVLEMALVRLARLDNLVPVSQMVQWLREGKVSAPAATARPAMTSAGVAAVDAEKKKLTAEVPAASGSISLNHDTLAEVWQQLSSQVGLTLRHELSKVISQAISGPNTLVLQFPHGYNVLEGTRKSQVEDLLQKITGQPWALKCIAMADAGNGAVHESPMARRRKLQDEALKQPLLMRAKEALGVQVVDMQDGFGEAARDAQTPKGAEMDEPAPGNDSDDSV